MIWSELYHFRMSGSTPTGQLLCSFTEAIRVASPFHLKKLAHFLMWLGEEAKMGLCLLHIFVLRGSS